MLVNNAGILLIAPIATMTPRAVPAGHRREPVRLPARHAGGDPEHVGERGGGAIVNISSTCGLQGTAGLSAYVSSKFAIRGMTKTAAIELGPLKIRVNAICPGGIDTAMGRGDDFGSFDTSAYFFAGMPIPRIGRPDEVARAAVFLASDEASYCTGAELLVDGGMLAGPAFGQV